MATRRRHVSIILNNRHVTRVCRVLAWMSENEHVAATTQYSTDNSDKGSSHRRSHKRSVSTSIITVSENPELSLFYSDVQHRRLFFTKK